jgi:hypothetical protein
MSGLTWLGAGDDDGRGRSTRTAGLAGAFSVSRPRLRKCRQVADAGDFARRLTPDRFVGRALVEVVVAAGTCGVKTTFPSPGFVLAKI